MDTMKYLGKQVKLIDVDNDVFIGHVVDAGTPEDNDDYGMYDISLEGKNLPKEGIIFEENEIKSIEVIN